MRIKYIFGYLFLTLAAALIVSAQPKLPSGIDKGFVLEFAAPFDRILIQSNRKNLPNPDFAEIFITPNTKLKNHKGKPAGPETIRPGMTVDVKFDKTKFPQLIAKEVKNRINPDEREEKIDGYLDRIEDGRATADGRVMELAPGAFLKGEKGMKIYSFKDIPLGSLLDDLEGVRQPNGVVLIKSGKVRPNLFTPTELKLVETVKKGLTFPPPNQPGAGIVINDRSYKVCEDLEVNTYLNKVGMRIVPKFLRFLPPEDPNKILFRFYVLEDDTPNAVAFSDGSVFVHTGLLRRLENEAQLAIILGHEIAHVTNEHIRRRYEDQQKMAFWAGVIGGVGGVILKDEELARAIAKLTFSLMSNKYDDKLEEQADRVGLFYAFDAGYDIRESTNLWRRLMGGYREDMVGNVLYSDHPLMLGRLKEMRREVILNYSTADFSEAVLGRDKFVEGVGVYFGWIAPKPKPTPTQPTPKTTNTAIGATKGKTSKTKNAPPKTQSAKKTASVSDGFNAFFANFKKAVSSNNRTALKKMMSSSFEWALDGYISRDEAFKLLDKMKLWAGLRNTVLRKPVKCKDSYCNNRAGYRVWSAPKYRLEIMFEKDANGNWFWTALLGD
jgi:hypothetical protein